jgi:hypothetical protein
MSKGRGGAGTVIRCIPAAAMSGLLFVMMWLPLILAAVIVVSAVVGVFFPYHDHPPAQVYTGDPPMPLTRANH